MAAGAGRAGLSGRVRPGGAVPVRLPFEPFRDRSRSSPPAGPPMSTVMLVTIGGRDVGHGPVAVAVGQDLLGHRDDRAVVADQEPTVWTG